MADVEEALDLRDYLRVLQRRKWTIAVVTALVFAGALAFSLSQTPLYRAQARILVEPLFVSPQRGAEPVIADTEIQVIESEEVAGRVLNELDLQGNPEDVLDGLEARSAASGSQVFTQSQVFEINYTSTDPAEARDRANAFAQTYREYRADRALGSLESSREEAQERLNRLSAQLTDVTQEIREAESAGNNALATTLELQRNLLLTRLGLQQQRLDDLQASESLRSGGVQSIAAANLPAGPVSPNPVRDGILGLLVGLMLGTGLGFVRERLDDRFHDRSEVEVAIATVLASIPRYRHAKERKGKDVVVLTRPTSLAAEAYRSLRTNLVYLMSHRSLRSFLITSPGTAEGKTVTTANLGAALAQGGHRVVVVSADLRRPSLEDYFDLPSSPGLTNWLTGETEELTELLLDPGVPNLRVVASGPTLSYPAELLANPRMGVLLRLLEENADVVVIDTPPILAVSDAAIVSRAAGTTILVINGSKTHRSAAVQAREGIDKAGGTVTGTVVNGVEGTPGSYGYGYYYSRYEPKEPEETASEGATGNGESRQRRRLFRP